MGKFIKWAKIILVVTASGGVGFTLAGFLLRDWDFSGWQLTQPIATIIASIIGLTAAWIAFDNGQKTREQDKEIYETKSRSEQERALRERFTSIIELLATDDLTKRESGAYALVALADDWANFYNNDQESALREQQVCLNILASQLRDPISTEQGKQELFFKEIIQEIIFSRFKTSDNQENEGRKPGIWSDLKLDLRECHFYNLHTKGAHFNQKVYFSGSIFSGDTYFINSIFKREASFEDVEFFEMLCIAGSTFEDDVHFDSSTFKSFAIFDKLKFKKRAYFLDVDFLNAALFGVAELSKLEEAKPEEARTEFCGEAHFDGTRFFGSAVLSKVKFHHTARFSDVQFRINYEKKITTWQGVKFHGAEFCGDIFFSGSMFTAPENHADIEHLNNITNLKEGENIKFSVGVFPEHRKIFHGRNAAKIYRKYERREPL